MVSAHVATYTAKSPWYDRHEGKGDGVDFDMVGRKKGYIPGLAYTPIEDRPVTRREREVWANVARGMTYHEIGRDLGISPHTVKVHLNSLHAKTDTQSMLELCVPWYGGTLARKERNGIEGRKREAPKARDQERSAR